ncbi:unnamed protein product [Rhizophagus irregularis]|nr:unnamed protein product [Rhizophagus irregularis]CAB5303607.1 unnamed protein product [Rhizophagus irregularis]
MIFRKYHYIWKADYEEEFFNISISLIDPTIKLPTEINSIEELRKRSHLNYDGYSYYYHKSPTSGCTEVSCDRNERNESDWKFNYSKSEKNHQNN